MPSMDALHFYSSAESDICTHKPVRGVDLQPNICWQMKVEAGPRTVRTDLWTSLRSVIVGHFKLRTGFAFVFIKINRC